MIVKSVPEIKEAVFASLRDKNLISIFPTEIARRFWVHLFVKEGKEGILRLDATMAWDTFKGQFLPEKEQLPTNNLVRELFALNFLRENPASQELKWFCYDDFPQEKENLATAIRQLVTTLKEIEGLEHLPPFYKNDAQLVKRCYEEFLEANGYYEPLFWAPSAENFKNHTSQRYRLFFPEVCQGWQEFSQMEPFPPYLETVHLADVDQIFPLQLYDNELMEVCDKLNQIKELVDSGVDYSEIIITVGNLDRVKPFLEHEATIRGLPLTVVEGESPLKYSAGKFLSLLANLYNTSFAATAMRALLLEVSIPWLDYERHIKLIERSVQLNIMGGAYRDAEDEWIRKLTLSGETALVKWYKTLKRGLLALMQAQDINAFYKAYFSLQGHLLKEQGFLTLTETNRNVYLYILDFLAAVGQTMQNCHIRRFENLFPFILKLLAKQKYIENRPIAAIVAYSYKVAVGVCPPYHFVIGCDQRSTEIRGVHLPLLHESYIELKDDDESANFLKHYHYCGQEVTFSASQMTFGGDSSLVPLYFIGRAQRATYDSSRDLLVVEERAWSAPSKNTFVPYEHQRRWLEQASQTAFKLPSVDFAIKKRFFSLTQRAKRSGELVPLSATTIDAFSACPFKWASKNLFRVEKGPYDPILIDHAKIGEILHSTVAQFFTEIGRFEASSTQRYEQLILEIAQKKFEAYRESPSGLPDTTLFYLKNRHFEELRKFISEEGKKFNGWDTYGMETPLSYQSEGYLLRGRIDRIAQSGAKVAVVDYKKGEAATRREYEKEIPTYQLPVYAKLIKNCTALGEVSRAAFYAFSQGSYKEIWKEEETEWRAALIEALDKMIATMLLAIEEGIIGATPSKKACEHCEYRQICRRRYALP